VVEEDVTCRVFDEASVLATTTPLSATVIPPEVTVKPPLSIVAPLEVTLRPALSKNPVPSTPKTSIPFALHVKKLKSAEAVLSEWSSAT